MMIPGLAHDISVRFAGRRGFAPEFSVEFLINCLILFHKKQSPMQALSWFTLGQYYPGQSLIHRVDPRAKMIFLVLGMVSIFARDDWRLLGTWVGISILLIWLSRIPAIVILRNLRPFLWVFLFIFILNFWLAPSGHVDAEGQAGAALRYAALLQAAFYCVRVALFLIISSLFSLTTSPLEVTDAVESLMRPLKRFRIPVHEFAMMAAMAIRFIPTIIGEAERLRKALYVRGVRFEGSLIKRIRALPPFILPLFLATFRRAEDLALAMEARCYDSRSPRSTYYEFVWAGRDTLAVLLAASLTLLPVLL